MRVALTCAIAVAACGTAGAGGVDFAFGVYEIEGEFESASDVKFLFVPLDATFGDPSSRLRFRIPYLRIGSTGNVTMSADGPIILGIGGPGKPSYQTSIADDSESGLGDIIISDETFILRGGRGKTPALAISADIKLATADEKKGLGTGERDWGVHLRYIQPLTVHWSLLANVGRRFMKSPEGYQFEDRWLSRIGLEAVTRGAFYRITLVNQTPVMDLVPVFDATGMLTPEMFEVEDRTLARFDIIRRKASGGTSVFGIWAGLNDSTEDLGFVLSWSTGYQ